MRKSRKFKLWACGLALAWVALPVTAYDGDVHQQLTFIAAKQFSRCAQSYDAIQHPSALDTRYIVRANVAQAESNVFTRMFRWNYYNRDDQRNRTSMWLIDTRFHGHFDGLTSNLADEDRRRQRLRMFGRLLSYLQDVTSPPHVVPVFTNRWWRFSFSDRFDRFPLDVEAIEQRLQGRCGLLLETLSSFDALLAQTANDTIDAVQSRITGFPTTWESYWELADDPQDFGEYGPAGNQFGERTDFRCGNGDRCLLLEDDPLYRAFANERHTRAVEATMRAMMLMQELEFRRNHEMPLQLNAD